MLFTSIFFYSYHILPFLVLFEVQLQKYRIALKYKYLGNYLLKSDQKTSESLI